MYLPTDNQSKGYDQTSTLIVGAGPAGLGVAIALKEAGLDDMLIVDAREIGASFLNWPRQMSLLTPSFHSNPFGLTDLNAIEPETSPADFLRTQHPTGKQYAKYLEAVVRYHELPVHTGVSVTGLRKQDDQFIADTSQGYISADIVVWATGQFFNPRDHAFPGAELALHSSKVQDWSECEGDEFTIIGGYESGLDAAFNLVEMGKSVSLHSKGEPWSSDDPDPSRSLSPRTMDRVREILKSTEKTNRLELYKNSEIHRIEENNGWWTLFDQDDIHWGSPTRPILANGFHSGLGIVENLFEFDENGLPVFTEEADESTITQGLFYSGPALVHRNSLFCFIYKFRSRFGVVALEIASRLGLLKVEEKLTPHLKAGFMNTDLDCCTNCECVIEPEGSVPAPASFPSG